MKYIIPYISKKPNPDAGKDFIDVVSGPTEITISVDEPLIETKELRLASHQPQSDYPYVYVTYNEGAIPKILNGIINRNTPIQRIYTHSPQPDFIYEYANRTVECDSCEALFYWRELKSDSIDHGDYGYSYSDTICPECGEWNCCELEFQK